MRLLPDLPDMLFLTGLALVGYGTWMIDPSLSLVLVGLISMLLGAAGARARRLSTTPRPPSQGSTEP